MRPQARGLARDRARRHEEAVGIATLKAGLDPEQIARLRQLAGKLDAEGEKATQASPRAKAGTRRRRPASIGKTIRAEIDAGLEPPLPGVAVTCCACGEAFPLSSLGGTRRARVCPLCGAPLTEEAFDERAREVLDSPGLRAFRDARDALALVNLRKADNRLRRWGLTRLAEALRVWLDGRAARRCLAAFSSEGMADEQLLFSLAQARYLTGRWFLDTRRELDAFGRVSTAGGTGDRPAPADDPRYRIDPSYDDAGTFRLVPHANPARGRGMRGEFRAFEAARTACEQAIAGPLADAEVIADLYLPLCLGGGSPSGKRWAQVDLVVLTTRAVLVCEVKAASFDVTAADDCSSMHTVASVAPNGRRRGPKLYDAPLRQARSHRWNVRDALPDVPRDRFYGAVLLAGEGRVRRMDDGFRDRMYVGALRDHPEESFERFAEAIADRQPFTTPAGVRELTKTLRRYADPTHEKRPGHIRDVRAAMRGAGSAGDRRR